MVIPKTLNECYEELKKIDDLDEWLNNNDEDAATATAHHSLGRWIRNNWGLWKGEGELYEWFKLNEIDHPDDMSNIILTSFYRHMKGKEIKLIEQIDTVVEFYLTEKGKILRRRNKKLNRLNENSK